MNDSFHNMIEDFLDGKLAGEELLSFRRALATDSSLAEALATARLGRELARQRPDFMRMIVAADKKVSPEAVQDLSAKTSAGSAVANKGRASKMGLLIIPLLFAACLLFWYLPEKEAEVKPTSPTLVEPNTQTPTDTLPRDDGRGLKPTEEAPEKTTTPSVGPKPPASPVATTPPIADAGLEQKYRQLALDLYEPYAPIVLRGSEDIPASTDSFALAKIAYEASDWAEVIRVSPTSTSSALKLRAHAAFQSGKYPLAAELFTQLEQSDRFYRKTAQWFRLLTLAADGRHKTPEFKELLAILTTSEHPYAEDAQAFKN